MAFNELENIINLMAHHEMENEWKFAFEHGLRNIEVLKFKAANTVSEIMSNYDEWELTIQQKKFILDHSNKEVLAFKCWPSEDDPDIFVYGDNNIAFRLGCFV